MTDHTDKTAKPDQQALRAQVASLVHDISTPLLTIRALAEAMTADGTNRATFKAGIDSQLDRIHRELDAFWHRLAPDDTAGPDAASPDAAALPRAPLAILVVDDDEIHREIGYRLLSKLGHRVRTCTDAEAARALEQDTRFDIVLLDEHGPGERGSDYARARRQAFGPGAAYLVGMSSDPRAAEIEAACQRAGMQDYVGKPLTPDKLKAMLARFVRQRGS